MGNGRGGKPGKKCQDGENAPPAEENPEGGGWKAARTWVAGIVGAVLVAAIGAVFTAWLGSRGTDVIDRVSGAPPVTIGHVAVDTDDRDIALREPVTDPEERRILLGAHTTDDERQALLTRRRAAVIDWMNITVVLVGNRSSMRIVDLKPRIVARESVSDGAYLKAASGSGEVGTVELRADLDKAAPRFVTAKDPGVRYFSTKQIDLTRDERVTLSMTISGTEAYYEFDLLATVLAEERAEQLVINGPGGGPFRLTGGSGTYRSFSTTSSLGGWAPMPAAEACELFPKTRKC
ncbi:hypothetical protein ACFV0L_37685 [Streptosporangium canum]|uniref:hypothetical protein n=1 Tax=Streptosporangium canum TaxID=324952 RepID=UPI003675B067